MSLPAEIDIIKRVHTAGKYGDIEISRTVAVRDLRDNCYLEKYLWTLNGTPMILRSVEDFPNIGSARSAYIDDPDAITWATAWEGRP